MNGTGATVCDARPEDADAVFVLARVLARSFVPRRSAFDAVFVRVGADDDHRKTLRRPRHPAVAGR